MEITLNITQEAHDCVLSQLRKKQTVEPGQLKDESGELRFEEDGTTPIMGEVGVFEADGTTPVLEDDLTVQEWAQAALDGKVNKCMKRMKKMSSDEEITSLKARIAELEGN